MVIGLASTQGAACICYWVIFSILLYLLQYSIQAIFGWVRLQQEGPLQVCKGQDRCHSTFLFQHVESFFSGSSQRNRMILQLAVPTAQEITQQLGYSCEVLYKVAEIPYGPDKPFLTPVYVIGGPICAISSLPFCLGSIPLVEISWPRICYLLFEEVAFGSA